MAFGATLSITINAVAKVLNRVSDSEPYSSEYLLRESTGEYRVKIRHSHSDPKGIDVFQRGVDRHNMEFVHLVYATPTSKEIRRKIYTVIEHYGADDVAAVSLEAVGFFSYAGNATRVDDQLAFLS